MISLFLSRSLISFFLFLSLSFTLSFQSISESPSGWAFLISFLSFLLSLQERSAAVCVCVCDHVRALLPRCAALSRFLVFLVVLFVLLFGGSWRSLRWWRRRCFPSRHVRELLQLLLLLLLLKILRVVVVWVFPPKRA